MPKTTRSFIDTWVDETLHGYLTAVQTALSDGDTTKFRNLVSCQENFLLLMEAVTQDIYLAEEDEGSESAKVLMLHEAPQPEDDTDDEGDEGGGEVH